MNTPQRMNRPRRMNAPRKSSMFPHTVTLYQTEIVPGEKYRDKIVNHITVLEGVLLIESKAANVRATGMEGADAANLHIPFGVKATDGVTGKEKTHVDPIDGWKTAEDKSSIWTIAIGTVFVKGRVVEPDMDQQKLELTYDGVYRATKVDKLDLGGFPHWEVGGG